MRFTCISYILCACVWLNVHACITCVLFTLCTCRSLAVLFREFAVKIDVGAWEHGSSLYKLMICRMWLALGDLCTKINDYSENIVLAAAA